MIFRILCFSISAGISISNSIFAQSQDLEFERISLQQGLSQTSVFSIVQDRQGFLWFGTQDGLNKYDGYKFTVYHRDILDTTSLSDNYITVLYVDRSGTLWTGTKGGGLNRFVSRTQQFVHYRHDPADSTSLSSDEVVCICEDRAGILWIGTPNGLNKFDRSVGVFIHYSKDGTGDHILSNNYVQTLYEDGAGVLWIGMIDGSAALDAEGKISAQVHSGVRASLYDSFAEVNHGEILAATPQDILHYDHGRWKSADDLLAVREKIPAHILLRSVSGPLWAGSNDGLYRIDASHHATSHYIHDASNAHSLSGNAVLSLFEDRAGILWVGTYEGINKYAPRRNRFRHVSWLGDEPHNIEWNKVRAFTEDSAGMLWIATQQGLALYDPSSDELTRMSERYPIPKSGGTDLIWSLTAERNTSLPVIWVGTNGNGLIKLEARRHDGLINPAYTNYVHRDDDPRSLSGNVIFSLTESHSGELWIGTLLEGLDKFDTKTGVFTRFKNDPSNPKSIGHNEIWSLCEDHEGVLWIGTAGGGLNRYDERSKSFDHFVNDRGDPNSLSDNKVLSIIEDHINQLWVGTYAGLNRFDSGSRTFTRYNMKDGLPDDVIYAIEEDKSGFLWLSTNKGLSKFDARTEKFRNYDAGDGLQSDEFNHGAAFKSRNGDLYFGGINGFNVFQPDSIRDNPTIPQLVFTDIKVFDKSLSPSQTEERISKYISESDEIHLSYKDNVFSLSFAALEYTNPAKNNYAYIMEGFDKDWRYAGPQHEATYTNLDPGAYTFRVKASNNDGVWNEAGASVRIFVAPPFWQTWWFRMLGIICFLSAGPVIYLRRVAKLKREKMIQQEFSRQLIDSQETERKRIAGELHDSIGQDLLIIKNKLLLGLQSAGNSGAQESEVRQAIDFVSRSLKNVREISRNLRPVQLDQLGLTAALESIIETVSESTQIQAEMRFDNVDNLLDKQSEINFFRIVQECLNNILKHSGATKFVVEIRKLEKNLELCIADNGRGILAAAPEKRGFGLSSMSERARILGGELHVQPSPGGGTRVSLTIPLPKENHD